MIRTVWSLAVCLLVADVASADPITFRFRGDIVTNLPAPYSILNGGKFEILYTFESTTPDSNLEDPASGVYYNAFISGQMKVRNGRNQFEWEIAPATLNDTNVQDTSTADAYFAGAYFVPQSGLADFDARYFIVQLVDRTRLAFASDELPTTLDLSQFEWLRNVQLTFPTGSCCATFGVITDIHVWQH